MLDSASARVDAARLRYYNEIVSAWRPETCKDRGAAQPGGGLEHDRTGSIEGSGMPEVREVIAAVEAGGWVRVSQGYRRLTAILKARIQPPGRSDNLGGVEGDG